MQNFVFNLFVNDSRKFLNKLISLESIYGFFILLNLHLFVSDDQL